MVFTNNDKDTSLNIHSDTNTSTRLKPLADADTNILNFTNITNTDTGTVSVNNTDIIAMPIHYECRYISEDSHQYQYIILIPIQLTNNNTAYIYRYHY